MMKDRSVNTLVKELFYYLDKVEHSDSGATHKPNVIRSTRVLDGAQMENILAALRHLVFKDKE